MFRRTWIDETVKIATPAPQLHALLREIDQWPDWTRGLRAIKRRTRDPLQVGGRFVMVLAPGIPLPCQLFQLDERRIEWGGGLGPWSIRHSFEITPIDASSCSLRHLEYAEGLLAIVTMPFERIIHAYDARWTKTIVARFAGA